MFASPSGRASLQSSSWAPMRGAWQQDVLRCSSAFDTSPESNASQSTLCSCPTAAPSPCRLTRNCNYRFFTLIFSHLPLLYLLTLCPSVISPLFHSHFLAYLSFSFLTIFISCAFECDASCDTSLSAAVSLSTGMCVWWCCHVWRPLAACSEPAGFLLWM